MVQGGAVELQGDKVNRSEKSDIKKILGFVNESYKYKAVADAQ